MPRPHRNHLDWLRLAVVLVIVLGCGGGDSTTAPPVPAAPSTVSAVGETTRSAVVGEPAGSDLVVRVAGPSGAAVSGVPVTFEVASGAGAVTPAVATTGATGEAVARWTLGGTAGAQTVQARVASLPAVEFTAVARAGAAASLALTTQPADARVGEAPRTPATIEVRDRFGNRTADAVAVTAAVAGGPGTISGPATVTSQNGVATFPGLVLDGPVGERTLRFTAAGVAPAVSSPVLLRPPPRASSERPDDRPGPQVHVVYAIPSDGVDRGLDTLPTLAYSVAAFQRWLAAQLGGPALRLDTYRGALDVTFFRLASTDAAMQARGAAVRDEIERQLEGAGVVRPDRIYAVYYDGGSTYACGGASWPPHVAGRLAAMYLRGTPGGVRCGDQAFVAAPTDAPRYWEFAMLHDLLHTLGIASRSAPNHTAAYPAHVPEPTDLMYTGPAPWQIGSGMVVDVGGDDYHGPKVGAGLATITGSRYVGGDAPVLAAARAAALHDGGPVNARIFGTRPRDADPWHAAGALPPHPPFANPTR